MCGFSPGTSLPQFKHKHMKLIWRVVFVSVGGSSVSCDGLMTCPGGIPASGLQMGEISDLMCCESLRGS